MIQHFKSAGRLLVCASASASISGAALAQTPSPNPGASPASPGSAPAPVAAPTETSVPTETDMQPDANTDPEANMQPASGVAAPGEFPGTTLPPAPEERRDVVERSWPNRPMLITGAAVLGASYGTSVIVAAVSDREADDKLFIPVVGPWMTLTERDCDVDPCNNETLKKALLVGDGILQGVGALTLVLSLVIPESREKPWYLIGNSELSVAPQIGSATTGLTAIGQF